MSQGTRRARVPGSNDELACRLAGYRPRGIDGGCWQKVRPFVLDCAPRFPSSSWASMSRDLRAVSCLAAWAVREGIPLDCEAVFDPDTVERFVAYGLSGRSSRATYRSVLRRIGPLLTIKAPWEPRTPAVARRHVASPYTLHEIRTLSFDARQQSTGARVRAARSLLALGAGAGLDGRWVTRVRAEDVKTYGGVVVVRVGDPSPRAVPVLGRWESEVRELASNAGDEYLVGGYSTSRNRANYLASSLEIPPGHPKLSAARLRATWLGSHLEAGTRLPELAAAAGLQGITVLSDLLPVVEPLSEQEAKLLLRGAQP